MLQDHVSKCLCQSQYHGILNSLLSFVYFGGLRVPVGIKITEFFSKEIRSHMFDSISAGSTLFRILLNKQLGVLSVFPAPSKFTQVQCG